MVRCDTMSIMTRGLSAGGPAGGSRWASSAPRPEDVLLALGCAVLALVSLVGRISPPGESQEYPPDDFRAADGFGIGLVLLGSGAVLVGRARPLLALAVVDASMFTVYAVGYVPPPLPAAELVVLYAVASTLRAAVSAAATAVTALGIVTADLVHDVSLDDDKLVAYLLSVVMASMVGYIVQVSRAQTRTAEENARLLAGQQQARTLDAVNREKERLTREMHDIVAHGIGVMVALASAARIGARSRTPDAEQALTAIESTGRAALEEMRSLMRDLRGDEPGPMLTPSALRVLVERAQGAGLDVDLAVEGEPRPLPSSVDLAAFRVVQESLTNVLRHSGAARVRVTIAYQPEAVDIRVRDDGAGRLPHRRAEDLAQGHGRAGMQRRVDLLGGAFTARETPDGFEVLASIPLGSEP